jgi:hypothetical protein
MSAARAEPPSSDGFVVRLDEMLAELADAVADDRPISDAARIDRIARLEKLRAVTAALQAAEAVRFAQCHVAEQLAADVHPTKIGRGIAEQIRLACHISPMTAARRLNTARALWFELPDTYNQLRTGMQLPVEQGVACYAALRRQADAIVATGDDRSRDQIMADTLVERLTGQATAGDLNIELQLMMPLDALIKRDDPNAAVIPGYGPLPRELAWEILTTSRGRKWWRRLFTAPTRESNRRGPLVGGEPTRRYFDGWLAKLVRLRDQTCRDPFGDAPIRHIDHITRHSDGGPTTFTNGRGVCARGNLTREMPGWHITRTGCSYQPELHKIIITTPTGHHYLSRAPDPP